MKTIYKYSLPIADDVHVLVPKGAIFLKVAYQQDTPYAWFEVDSEEEVLYAFYYTIFGTGMHIPSKYKGTYLDTIFDPSGFVWHIYKD